MIWKGVVPAITTCFDKDLQIDYGFLAEHCRWLLDNGCSGVVVLGSLGEGATLSFDERVAIVRTAVKAVHGRGPVVASISALSTAEAMAQAKAERCDKHDTRGGRRMSKACRSLKVLIRHRISHSTTEQHFTTEKSGGIFF